VAVTVQNEKQSVRLTVADTGIGIPAEHQERIFERFYRVDKSHSKAIGGTGLGLSIVKHAARLHNASIELTSEPGKGTTISVIFPEKRKI
jgi:two-component system phosphate regulon sensor histidine kinase PhoR